MTDQLLRLAAFAQGETGGNPAGVMLCDTLPAPEQIQAVAAALGYSETVFAAPAGSALRVRYYAPAAEIPFCGHATVALGAALAMRGRTGPVELELAAGTASVEGWADGSGWGAALVSPPTVSSPASSDVLADAMRLFGLAATTLDPALPPAIMEAGARHLVLALRQRSLLASMRYDFDEGAALMRAQGLATIALAYREGPGRFRCRNAFAGGGVYEDPATGAAAAALLGYLRDLADPDAGAITVVQGEEMGVPCLLRAEGRSERGSPVRVSGAVRIIGSGFAGDAVEGAPKS